MREHVKVLQVMYMHASREPKWQAEAEALDAAIAALTRSEVPAGWVDASKEQPPEDRALLAAANGEGEK